MKTYMLLLLMLLTAGMVTAQDAQTPADLCAAAPTDEPASREFAQAEQVLEEGVDYRAVLCTDAGAVYVDLYEDFAPLTVNNFVFLAQQGFYNNTTFHRVIQDFMAQGGDPTGTGSGGPGYQFPDEFVGFLTFDRPGLLAMANANQPENGIVGTNGSQFFITTVPTTHLDYRHTIFGEVLEGQENVAALEIRDPQAAEAGTALNTVVIVTDPTTVTTTFVEPEHATQEEVLAAFNTLSELVPPEVENIVTSMTTEEVVASIPDNLQVDYETFLTTHNHEYRVGSSVSSCNLEALPFMNVSYTIDAFATREDAEAAFADPALEAVTTGLGTTETSTSAILPGTVFTEATSACELDATHAVTHWLRGRFLVTAEVTIPTDSPVEPDRWLSEIVGVRLFEGVLSDVLRREIR